MLFITSDIYSLPNDAHQKYQENRLRMKLLNFSIKPIKTIIEQLKVEGLGEINNETGLFDSWPQKEAWKDCLMLSGYGQVDFVPNQKIEKELESVEFAFNRFLASPGSDKKGYSLSLLQQIKGIQSHICHTEKMGAYHTYPYFVRWAVLHIAILKACEINGDAMAQSRLLILIEDIGTYLNDTIESASTFRLKQIQVKTTGIENETIFVQDTRNGKAMTKGFDAVKEVFEARALGKKIADRLAKKYIQESGFGNGFLLLDNIMKGLTIIDGSPAAELNIFKGDFKTLAAAKTAAPPDYEDFTDDECKKLSTYSSEVLGIHKKSFFQPLQLDENDDTELAKNILDTVVGLAGLLPIPGAGVISGITGLLLNWLMPDQPSLWDQIKDNVQHMVDKAISAADARNIENHLHNQETQYDTWLKWMKTWDPKKPVAESYKSFLITIISDLGTVQQMIYHPMSNSKRASLPFFERCFTLQLATFSAALRIGLDYKDQFFSLLTDTWTYLHAAMNEIYYSREYELSLKNENDGWDAKRSVWDSRYSWRMTDIWKYNSSDIDNSEIQSFNNVFWYLQCRCGMRAIACIMNRGLLKLAGDAMREAAKSGWQHSGACIDEYFNGYYTTWGINTMEGYMKAVFQNRPDVAEPWMCQEKYDVFPYWENPVTNRQWYTNPEKTYYPSWLDPDYK